jgi:hypothetical protein
MSDLKAAIRDAVNGTDRRLRLLLLVGVTVAVVDLVRAYLHRSLDEAIITVIVWLILYPILAVKYSAFLSSKSPSK